MSLRLYTGYLGNLLQALSLVVKLRCKGDLEWYLALYLRRAIHLLVSRHFYVKVVVYNSTCITHKCSLSCCWRAEYLRSPYLTNLLLILSREGIKTRVKNILNLFGRGCAYIAWVSLVKEHIMIIASMVIGLMINC